MSKEKFSIEINGITIKGDTLYQVIPKVDLNAPDGFVSNGTSKLLMDGIDEGAPCAFNEYQKVWDTGFYVKSPCYAGKKVSDVEILVAELQEHIVKPFEEFHGENALDHKASNNPFWDNFGGKLRNGKVFNTNKPKDLVELYIAILHNWVASPEGKSQNLKASYCIVNKEAATSVKEQRQGEKLEGIGNYYTMLNNNREELLDILEYNTIISDRKMDDKTLTGVVMTLFEDPKEGFNSIKRFVEAVKRNKFPKSREEFSIHSSLTELRRKRKITQQYGELYFGDELLGSNLKDATARVMKDKDLKIKIADALEPVTA